MTAVCQPDRVLADREDGDTKEALSHEGEGPLTWLWS
jgi:hypothetical protein